MAKKRSRKVYPDVLYTCEELAETVGRSQKEVETFVRQHCVFGEPWEDTLLVLGRDFISGVQSTSKADAGPGRKTRRRKTPDQPRRPHSG